MSPGGAITPSGVGCPSVDVSLSGAQFSHGGGPEGSYKACCKLQHGWCPRRNCVAWPYHSLAGLNISNRSKISKS
eukprot:52668-Chlamydomonas_euryale.AAC.2